MLGTINAHISSKQCRPVNVTTVLDSGSQSTLITTKCAFSLGINTKHVNMILKSISNMFTRVKGLARINISTLDGLKS